MMSSGQYSLTVATFHKRNQDTNSFRTGQQFLIKLDLKSAGSDPFKNPLSLILPRRMVQGHPKTKQAEAQSSSVTASASTGTTSTSTGVDPSDPAATPAVAKEIQDAEAILGNDLSKFYLEVTVHLASSESIVQACPECCHKVEGKVRKPSTGPSYSSRIYPGGSDYVDPGQILQFCVPDHVVDFSHGTSTVMAKVLCSSTHHDKRGNNDRYFFKFTMVQYTDGQKLLVGSCRTKDILFTGNHKNKSMASFSEDKGETKPRTLRDDELAASSTMLIAQSVYSEEPDSMHDEPMTMQMERSYSHSHHHPGSYDSPRSRPPTLSDHLPRIQEPMVMPMAVDPSRQNSRPSGHDAPSYTNTNLSARSPTQPGTTSTFNGSNQEQHQLSPSHPSDSKAGYALVKSKSWNDTLITPNITRIIPDVGDMLGGTEVTIFGSGFRAGLVPYFDSVPATNVTILHSDVLTCRTPPRIYPKIASVAFHSRVNSHAYGRATQGAQFSYADKTGLVLAELVAEILVMGHDDYDEPQARSGLGLSNYDVGDRAEQRLGGLGDMRSRATRVVRRGSMRRDSSDVATSSSHKSSYGAGSSRLNPMAESPRRMSSHSPTMQERVLDDDELERLVADMMSLSVTQSIVPTPQTCRALEDAILKNMTLANDIQHISLQNDQRHTMLHLAVVLEMDRLVEYLLKERIEINAADWNGFTALHYAAWTGQRSTYENLEKHGASSEIPNCHLAVARYLFSDQPGVPADFVTMYHNRETTTMDGVIQQANKSARDSYLNNSNLKDDIHEAYSRAKKAKGSGGNIYMRSMSGDSAPRRQMPHDTQREIVHEPHSNMHASGIHQSPRSMVSSPPQSYSEQQQHIRPRPSSQSMGVHSSPLYHAPPRSPSPLRESHGGLYSQAPSGTNGGSNSSAPRRYLHPVDVPPTRTGSLPSIRFESEHRDREREHHQKQQRDAHSPQHGGGALPYRGSAHHRAPSPSSSPSNGPVPTSPMHRQRYASSPGSTSYDHPSRSPQHHHDSMQDESARGQQPSDRMLPSFGLNLPVPFTYQNDGSRGQQHEQQGGEMNDGHHHSAKNSGGNNNNGNKGNVSGNAQSLGAGQKRSSPYHANAQDVPSPKSARVYDETAPHGSMGNDTIKSDRDYGLQGSVRESAALAVSALAAAAAAAAATAAVSATTGATASSSSSSSIAQDRAISEGKETDDGSIKGVRRAGGGGSASQGSSHTCPHPNCNKSFTRPFNLRAHMRVHTAERPYKCDVCALAFSRLHDRNRHAKLHTGIKPFECQFCHHQFIRPDALRRHLGRGGGVGCGQKAVSSVGGTSAAAGSSSGASGVSGAPGAKGESNLSNKSQQQWQQQQQQQQQQQSEGSGSTAGAGTSDQVQQQRQQQPTPSKDSTIITGHQDGNNTSTTAATSRSSTGNSMKSQTSMSSLSSAATLSGHHHHHHHEWTRMAVVTEPMELSEEEKNAGVTSAGPKKMMAKEEVRVEEEEEQEIDEEVENGRVEVKHMTTSSLRHHHGQDVEMAQRRFESPSGMDEDQEQEQDEQQQQQQQQYRHRQHHQQHRQQKQQGVHSGKE